MSLFLRETTSKKGVVSYTIYEGHRTKEGHKQTTYKKLGPLSDFSDPRAEAERILNKEKAKLKKDTPWLYTIDLDRRRVTDVQSRNLGFLAYLAIYHELNLDEAVNRIQDALKPLPYHLNTVIKFLLSAMLLEPETDPIAVEAVRTRFFPDESFTKGQCIDAMGILLENRKSIIEQLSQTRGARSSSRFLVITDEPVEIELFLDANGLPLTYTLAKQDGSEIETPETEQQDTKETHNIEKRLIKMSLFLSPCDIRASMFLAFLALVIERTLAYRMAWKHTPEEIQQALSDYDGTLLAGTDIYQTATYDNVLHDIGIATHVDFFKVYFTPAMIKKYLGER